MVKYIMPFKNTIIQKKLILLLIFITTIIFLIYWCLPHQKMILMGDDLDNILEMDDGKFATNWHQIFFESTFSKYRPIFSLFFSAEWHLFRNKENLYIYINILISILSYILIYNLLLLLSKNKYQSFFLAFLFETARFNYYQLWQVTGIIEGLATFLFLVTIYFLYRAIKEANISLFWGALLSWTCLIYTHERYIIFLPVILLALALWPVGLHGENSKAQDRQSLILALAVILAAFSNFAIKKWLIKITFLTSTGGQTLAFDPVGFIAFFFNAFANVIGINIGPTYLSSESFMDAPRWVKACALMLAGISIWIVVSILVVTFLEKKRDQWRYVALYTASFGIALASASLTFRQEFRWLLAPYIIFLIGISYSGRMNHRAVPKAVLGCFVLLSLTLAVHYRLTTKNIFFMDSQAHVEDTKKLVDSIKRQRPISSIVLLTSPNGSICAWDFGGGKWFTLYADIPADHVFCVDQIDELAETKLTAEDHMLAISFGLDGHPHDVTNTVYSSLVERPPGTRYVDFFAQAQSARVRPDNAVSTPSGRGAFSGKWPTAVGMLPSLIVVSGYSLIYPPLEIRPDTAMTFSTTMIYPSAFQANAYAEIIDGAGTARRVWQRLLDAPHDGSPAPESASIDLKGFAGQTVSIVFGAETPSGDSSGHWVLFSNPALWAQSVPTLK